MLCVRTRITSHILTKALQAEVVASPRRVLLCTVYTFSRNNRIKLNFFSGGGRGIKYDIYYMPTPTRNTDDKLDYSHPWNLACSYIRRLVTIRLWFVSHRVEFRTIIKCIYLYIPKRLFSCVFDGFT